jgi:hypothetical protein
MGTVTLPTAATSDLTVNLASSNASATPSASVIVASGQKSANFTLTVVGDAILSSEQAVAVSASAAGYQAGQTVIVITNASVPLLVVAPTTTLSVSGLSSGPFSPASTAYTLTNPGPAAVAWACTSTDPKLIAISPSSGILGAGKSAMATVSFRSGVNVGPVGTYTPNITFTNRTNGRGDTEIPVAISVTGSLPAGSFNGLVTPPTGVTPTQGQAGLIRWTTTASGQFTGTLQLGGYTYALTGAVDSTGLVHFGRSGATPVTLLRGKLPSLELSLQLTLGGEIDQITGTVTEGGSPFAQIEAERAVYTSLKNPVPPLENPPTGLVGAYTAIFSFKAAPNNTLPATAYPQADGYGLLTVGSSGMVHIAGTLADGTAISYSNALTPAATWPVYVSLQSGNGSIGGVATFADNPGVSDLAGLGLYWFKPASATAKRYPGGWTGGIQTDLLGSKFVLPAKGSGQSLFPGLGPVSTMGNATAALTVDGVTDSESVDISASNVVTVLPPNPAKLGLSLSTSGLFSGSFTSAGKLVPLHGVVFQKQGQGFGFFLGADATGSVTLAP